MFIPRNLSIYLSIHPSIYLYVYDSIYIYIHTHVCIYSCLKPANSGSLRALISYIISLPRLPSPTSLPREPAVPRPRSIPGGAPYPSTVWPKIRMEDDQQLSYTGYKKKTYKNHENKQRSLAQQKDSGTILMTTLEGPLSTQKTPCSSHVWDFVRSHVHGIDDRRLRGLWQEHRNNRALDWSQCLKIFQYPLVN